MPDASNSHSLAKPSDRALSLIGDEITYTEGDKAPVPGVIVGCERTFSVMTTKRGQFPGIRYQIKPKGGGRRFWTKTFADDPEATDG